MNKMEMYHKAIELCVPYDDVTGRSYVEPLWREILEGEGIKVPAKEEVRMLETLTLAARKADAKNDRTAAVMDWLYDLISSQAEPAILQEETEYIQNVMEYMKLNSDLKNKEKNIEEREKKTKEKEEAEKLFPQMNFSRL